VTGNMGGTSRERERERESKGKIKTTVAIHFKPDILHRLVFKIRL